MCRGRKDVRVKPRLRTAPAQRSHSVCVTVLKVRHRSFKPTARKRGSLSNSVRRMWSNWTRWDINLGRTSRSTAASRCGFPLGKPRAHAYYRKSGHRHTRTASRRWMQFCKRTRICSVSPALLRFKKETYPPSICLFAQFLSFSSPLRCVPV